MAAIFADGVSNTMTHAVISEMRVAASAELLARGCVNVICLEYIKNQTGARWERLKGAVWAHLEGLLRQRLSPNDFYVQLDDVTFVLCSPSSNKDEAQIFCLRIAHELHSAMLGSCEMGTIRIARVASSTGDSIEIIPIAADALEHLARRAGLSQSGEARPTVMMAGATEPKQTFSHAFSPLWDSQREVVTTYRYISGSNWNGGENEAINVRLRSDIAMAVESLRHTAGILLERATEVDRFIAAIPISYDLLSSPVARMEIAAVCRSLPASLRSYLIFEISSLPHGVPQSRLSQLVGFLRPFCRGVMAQLPARTANYGAYDGIGLYAIGLNLSSPDSVGTEMESEVFKLCVAAKRQRILSFLFDVPAGELIKIARAMGTNILSSPLIGSPMEDPGFVRRLSMECIYTGR